MTKVAVISSVASNFEALCAVLEVIDRAAVDKVICLGGILGYGPSPNECIAVLRERRIDCLKSPLLDTICRQGDYSNIPVYLQQWMVWCDSAITDDNFCWLTGLDHIRIDGLCAFSHSNIPDPSRLMFINSPAETAESFAYLRKSGLSTAFIGCNKQPAYYIDGDSALYLPEGKCHMGDHCTIVDVGSVGAPRDGSPKAKYVIFDSKDRSIDFIQVSYDFSITQRKIIACGLPAFYAERLELGR